MAFRILGGAARYIFLVVFAVLLPYVACLCLGVKVSFSTPGASSAVSLVGIQLFYEVEGRVAGL